MGKTRVCRSKVYFAILRSESAILKKVRFCCEMTILMGLGELLGL